MICTGTTVASRGSAASTGIAADDRAVTAAVTITVARPVHMR
ncbi:hypothetical protein [Actinomadura hallensis]|nr:hypothetical protein [Actinomadura hallensis]